MIESGPEHASTFSRAPCRRRTSFRRDRASRLRIGAMMWQLPFYHPIRLAQEVAMLDQLSRGRVEFGTGESSSEAELGGFAIKAALERAGISPEQVEHVLMGQVLMAGQIGRAHV